LQYLAVREKTMSIPFPSLVLLVLLSLGTLVPAHAQTFGRTDVGAIPSAGLTANAKRGSKFTPAEPGTAFGLCAHLDGNGGVSGRQDFRLALYSDTGGVPSSKLAETSQLTIVSGGTPTWYCFDIGLVPVSTLPYWIVIHSGPTGGVARNFGDGPANWFGSNVDTFSDGASNPFGNGSFGTGTLSVYAMFTPASQLRNAGRTTIGTTPSNGMSANFKRGSSFTVSEPGRLSALTAYLDGLGATTAGQDIRLAVYRDANGTPGARISESLGGSFAAGMRARWITFATRPALIDPGRYWIVFHTGPTSGVLRNFADGSGNWYGNADLYADGASATFGAGNTGNGTISAFASYEPGEFVIRELGRTDIGAQPSKGLTANFMRGSMFQLDDRPGAVLTGLHAYLDGNGGAPGTQKLRMLVYEVVAQGGTAVGLKLAESAEVSIAAGTPPGWVHFPLPEVAVGQPNTPLYWIMLHSGDTGGVVRDYGGDGPDNWLGVADSYADFGGNFLPFESSEVLRGPGTLSIHATYSFPAE
jgi:hypothetical protein